MITDDANCSKEIKRIIAMRRAAKISLMTIWRDKNTSMKTETRLIKALIFPIVNYGAETWVMHRAEKKKVDSFELWRWRIMLQISWKDRTSNEQVLRMVKPGESFESTIARKIIQWVPT